MRLNFCEVSLRLYVQKLNVIVTVIQALRVALNPLQTWSLPKVVSRGSKSKTTVRYHTGKRGDYGVRKN